MKLIYSICTKLIFAMIINTFNELILYLKQFDNSEIEQGVVSYVCEKYGVIPEKNNYLYKYYIKKSKILSILQDNKIACDIVFIIKLFEALLEKDSINENGIVFTPKYIADYIAKIVKYRENCKIIDPGCGCGIFLISAIEHLQKKYALDVEYIINNNIYGIDINADNVRRCHIVLYLYAIMHNVSINKIRPNIICTDSLCSSWPDLFNIKGFDYIIGNPPYVNPHDMKKETVNLLKKLFKTTSKGTFNIFYAFIEQGMKYLKDDGKLSYIIPNNILTIKSAYDLRSFIQHHHYLEKIINFTDNLIFKPVRTYNCIIELSKEIKSNFSYCSIKSTKNIEHDLNMVQFDKMLISDLDPHSWRLLSRDELNNLKNIEGQFFNIKQFIKTGIATLSDNIYMVDYDGANFYKEINGVRYICENKVVKKIYKIPELKNNIQNYRYIIFPYKYSKLGIPSIIDEDDLKNSYPSVYAYLVKQRENLNRRDKGKINNVSWYAYGRSQGLSNFGKKILYPTFSDKPKFKIINEKDALFCNGYAIIENDIIDLEVLVKILNSKIMEYYISRTSYPIEGNCYCYQKKYIERFSIPYLSIEEQKLVKSLEGTELDLFLMNKYKVSLPLT